MSTLFWLELSGYLRERILTLRIGALWLLWLACALMAGAPALPAAALGALFIASLRLLDDLADLPHDRHHHPERVLVRSAAPQRFMRVCAGLIVLSLVALQQALSPGAALAGLLLVLALGAVYALTQRRPAWRPTRAALVLTKYPALVLLLAPHPGSVRAGLAAALVYLILLADEARSAGTALLAPAAVIAALALLLRGFLTS